MPTSSGGDCSSGFACFEQLFRAGCITNTARALEKYIILHMLPEQETLALAVEGGGMTLSVLVQSMGVFSGARKGHLPKCPTYPFHPFITKF